MSYEARYVGEGDTISYTPGGAVAAGEVVVVSSNVVCVAAQPIAASVEGSVYTKGVFEVAKTAALDVSDGDAIYWNDGTNKATKTATDNYMGTAVYDSGVSLTTVFVNLRSIEAAAVETLALDDLTDIDGALAYTAGHILVADGDSFEEVAVSGDATLSSAGVVTLNTSKAYQTVIIRVEDLAAGVDIANRPIFAIPTACTLVSAGILSEGAPAGIDAGNTCVILLEDQASNAIVTVTYDNANIFPTSDYEDLGALDGVHKALAAEEMVWLSVTNGATANPPAFSIVLTFEVTNV